MAPTWNNWTLCQLLVNLCTSCIWIVFVYPIQIPSYLKIYQQKIIFVKHKIDALSNMLGPTVDQKIICSLGLHISPCSQFQKSEICQFCVIKAELSVMQDML